MVLKKQTKKTILIVDDDSSNLKVFSMIIQSWGVDVMTARNGKEALEALKIKKPDLILLDIKMPRIDGYKVCEILKKKWSTRKIPIILLTGLNELESIKKGYRLGVEDYFIKPVQWDHIKFKILKLLKYKF